MAWNEPDKGKDAWNTKKPPDLDEILKRLQSHFKKKLKKSSSSAPIPPKGGLGILGGVILFVVFILWALSGIFIVDPAEQAAILRFGKYRETVGPGPHWIPRFIDSKIVMNVDRVSDYSYSAQMLTKDENLVSVSLVVQYRINDLQAYLFNVVDPQESLAQATSSALRQVVGNTTLDQIITAGRETWGNNVQDSLIKILDIYKTGIRIVNVSPQPARAPENVQDAFDDAIKAQEDERRFKEQAFTYKARVVPIAEGNAKRILAEAGAYAQQIVLKAKGDVAEFLALLPEYKASPFVTTQRLYLDTMQQVLSNTTKVLVNAKSPNVLYLPIHPSQANDSMTPPSVMAPLTAAAKMDKTNQTLDSDITARNTLRPLIRQDRSQ